MFPSKVLELLEDTGAGVGGEIQLTDALDSLLDTDGLNAFETDAEVHDIWLKPRLHGYAAVMGVEIDVADIDAENKVTVRLK